MTGFILSIVCMVVLALLSVTFAGIWVYKDAKQRGLQAGLWTLLVILSGNFIGLILYLVIGRKNSASACGKCGARFNTLGEFCPSCGEKNVIHEVKLKSKKGWLVSCVSCLILAFVFLGVSVFLLSNGGSNGFIYNYKYGYYNLSKNGYVKKDSEQSSGNIWNLSFEEASGGYVFSNKYNAKTKPVSVTAEISCGGSITLIITQNEAVINENLQSGSHTFDMAGFNEGQISFELINIDTPGGFSGTISVKTLGE